MAPHLQCLYFQINLPEVCNLASLFTTYTVSPSAGYFTTIRELQKTPRATGADSSQVQPPTKTKYQFWFCKCIFKIILKIIHRHAYHHTGAHSDQKTIQAHLTCLQHLLFFGVWWIYVFKPCVCRVSCSHLMEHQSLFCSTCQDEAWSNKRWYTTEQNTLFFRRKQMQVWQSNVPWWSTTGC